MLSYKIVLIAVLSASAYGAPLPYLYSREVPQEHSHEPILTSVRASLQTNNPDQISDPVFGLLGDAAAAQGQGKISDVACLQQATADQAFTNAKTAGDVDAMTDALIFRALERNTGKVGQASAACTSITAVNPEIAALQQHQDPASDGAAASNKAVTLELAKQIASIGGDSQRALEAGTFAPGDPADATGKGNTCDDANDPKGCIFSQNLLVEDATADEITAAAGDAASSGAAAASNSGAADNAAAADNTGAAAGNATASAGAADSGAAAGNATAGAATGAGAASGAAAGNIGDFGSCSVPQIEFGVGFDNRKETSFQPTDKQSFNHGSAQNINIISQFICDTLTNSCKADDTAKATCATAQQAASAATAKTGDQADAFNAAFGIQTDFASVQAIDDQGNPVAGTGNGAGAGAGAAANAGAADNAAASDNSGASAGNAASSAGNATASAGATDSGAAAGAAAGAGASAAGDFGSCSVPQIEFGAGFDGRKETSFEPVDKQSFNHGSAQNIDIITQFICDTLTNSCKADDTAKATCDTAKAAASAATAKTGAQADAFNAAFGIQTDFTSVQAIDNQGNAVAGTGSSAAAGAGAAAASGNSTAGNASSGNAASASGSASSGNAASGNAASGNATASSANLQTFTGNLGGAPPAVTAGGDKGFVTDGSDFVNVGAALGRSCDVQHNACANAANSGGGFSVGDCDAQNNQCRAAAQA